MKSPVVKAINRASTVTRPASASKKRSGGLKEIATSRSLRRVAADRARSTTGAEGNLSSAIRLFVLGHYRQAPTTGASRCATGSRVAAQAMRGRNSGDGEPSAGRRRSGHFRLRDRRDLGVGLAHHAVAPAALGRIEAASARSISACAARPCAAIATPIEIVTRPRCSPVERLINSLVTTARRMWSATVSAARSGVFGRMMANSSPP